MFCKKMGALKGAWKRYFGHCKIRVTVSKKKKKITINSSRASEWRKDMDRGEQKEGESLIKKVSPAKAQELAI